EDGIRDLIVTGVQTCALPICGLYLPPGGRWLAKPLKGVSGPPTSRSRRSAPPERGMAYRTRVPRSRSPRSSQRPGGPATGRRGTDRKSVVQGEGVVDGREGTR